MAINSEDLVMKWFAIIMLILVLWHMNERVTCLEHGHVCDVAK